MLLEETTDNLNGGIEKSFFKHNPSVVDTLIISDIHLGSDVCRSAELLRLLKKYSFKRLILNGDVFDDLNFKRLKSDDWDFLNYIRKLSNPKRHCEIVWVAGNHDGVAEILSHLLGVEVYDEYPWEFCGENYLAIHGHQFDSFITENVTLTNVASYLYLWIQKLDTEQQRMSRWVKRTSKAWLKNSEKIAHDAIEYARGRGARHVFCGHTHLASTRESRGIVYYNSGCWTDKPSQYITVDEINGVRICNW
ncbi:MAG TPA: UDP-2,3-diacylglucosamine diphosphatase [Patescibacteria group bacterium]|nr:UDP-2,3-diacylglucosamine diphosphatase [Patescibacteria group bacterium]